MAQLLVRNGTVAMSAGPRRADILCVESRIVAIGQGLEAPGASVIDATGLTVGPGFVDIHVHGGGGYSFLEADPEQIYGYSAWAPRHGVTAFLVSTLGARGTDTETVLARLAPAVIAPDEGAEPLGFHLEGPFLNPVRKGAFEADTLTEPSVDAFARFQEAAFGLIRQLTLAPELPGALDIVRAAAHTGASSAMGHSDASAAEAAAGFEAGVSHVTHLFNAMRPLHHREVGPAGAALLDRAVTCELICDGTHVSPGMARIAYRLLGPARTCVVTDNVSIAGLDGRGGSTNVRGLETRGGAAVRSDGTLVGSAVPMDQHFRNAISFLGLDLATAFRLCATNPARVAGAGRRKGVLDRGADADLVLLDDGLQVVATVCRGSIAWTSRA